MIFWTRVDYFGGWEIIYYFGDQENMWGTDEDFGEQLFCLGSTGLLIILGKT